MHRYAAILLGIAPSGKNMTNDKLRGVFEALGLEDVASVLASGNIVLGSAETGRARPRAADRVRIHQRAGPVEPHHHFARTRICAGAARQRPLSGFEPQTWHLPDRDLSQG